MCDIKFLCHAILPKNVNLFSLQKLRIPLQFLLHAKLEIRCNCALIALLKSIIKAEVSTRISTLEIGKKDSVSSITRIVVIVVVVVVIIL